MILFGNASDGLSRVSAAGGDPAPVTTLEVSRKEASHRWPHFLPDGRRFVFLAIPSNTIYLGSLDSKATTRLLSADSRATYAPPGYLLFVRGGTLMAQAFDADRAELTGEAFPVAERVLFSFSTGRAVFSVSDNGVLVYRAGEAAAPARLTWFDRSDKSTQPLGAPGRRAGVTLSPDAVRAVAHVHEGAAGGGLWLFDASRDTTSRFTFDSSHTVTPVWSRDGGRVAFASDREGGVFNLYQKLSSGAGRDELLFKSDESKRPTDWSLDGRLIVFESLGTKTGIDVWVLPLSGDRKPTVFLQTEFNEAQGQLSPDGRWMAYASDESGRFEVYIQEFPPSGGKWQISTNGGMLPRWRRDGHELFYLGLDRKLMSVDVKATSGALAPGVPSVLFETRAYVVPAGNNPYYAYAVTANGQRFVVAETLEGPESPPLTVVVDWLAALRR